MLLFFNFCFRKILNNCKNQIFTVVMVGLLHPKSCSTSGDEKNCYLKLQKILPNKQTIKD